MSGRKKPRDDNAVDEIASPTFNLSWNHFHKFVGKASELPKLSNSCDVNGTSEK